MSQYVTFNIAIPTDADGFVGRACDAPGCKQYFKIYGRVKRDRSNYLLFRGWPRACNVDSRPKSCVVARTRASYRTAKRPDDGAAAVNGGQKTLPTLG